MPIVKLPNGETARFPDEMKIEDIQREIEKSFPNLSIGQNIAKAVAPYARPALEYGGMAGGAILGAPSGPVGGVAGAGLGYAAGRQGANLIEEYAGIRKPQPVGERLLETAVDIPAGATMEMGGAIIGKGIEAVGSKLAPRVIESIAKIPPKSVPVEKRNAAIATSLEGKYAWTQGGLNKLNKDIDSVNFDIGKFIDKAAIPGATVNTERVLSRLDDLKDFYKDIPDPRPYLAEIDQIKKGIMEVRGSEIPVDVAQKMKQALYRLNRKHYGEMSSLVVESNKGIARGVKEELAAKYPELSTLNAKDSALINLHNVLERAVNRTRNWDIIGLSDIAGAAAGGLVGVRGGDYGEGGKSALAGLVFMRAIRDPGVASRLAFALSKAKTLEKLGAGRAAAYGAGKITEFARGQELSKE